MSFAPPNENFEKTVRKLLLGMPYLQWLELSFVHIAPGEVDLAMPLRRDITFDGKSVQAGPIGSLLDVGGLLVWFPGVFCPRATVRLKPAVHFACIRID